MTTELEDENKIFFYNFFFFYFWFHFSRNKQVFCNFVIIKH